MDQLCQEITSLDDLWQRIASLSTEQREMFWVQFEASNPNPEDGGRATAKMREDMEAWLIKKHAATLLGEIRGLMDAEIQRRGLNPAAVFADTEEVGTGTLPPAESASCEAEEE